jgi:nucleoside-diphosphate-sugar epimerase
MRVFVTGASGHIGTAVLPELVQAGHQVIGLARSNAAAVTVAALGGEVYRGDLADPAGLRAAAADADAVIHLAFDHQAMLAGDFAGAVATDVAVVQALGDALAGTGKTLIGIGIRRTADTQRTGAVSASPRSAVTREITALGQRDVRTILVAVPPVTHGSRDRHGFIPQLIRIARAAGQSGYVGDGANRWAAGHTLDVAALFRLALDKAPAGAQLFAAAEPGIPVREIAEVIARHLNVPAVSIPPEQAAAHFTGFPFSTLDFTMRRHPGAAGLDAGPPRPDRRPGRGPLLQQLRPAPAARPAPVTGRRPERPRYR